MMIRSWPCTNYPRAKFWAEYRHLVFYPSIGGTGDPDPAGKSEVAKGFFRNSGMDHHQEAIEPFDPIASRGRYVRPSVQYIDYLKNNNVLTEFSGSTYTNFVIKFPKIKGNISQFLL